MPVYALNNMYARPQTPGTALNDMLYSLEWCMCAKGRCATGTWHAYVGRQVLGGGDVQIPRGRDNVDSNTDVGVGYTI